MKNNKPSNSDQFSKLEKQANVPKKVEMRSRHPRSKSTNTDQNEKHDARQKRQKRQT